MISKSGKLTAVSSCLVSCISGSLSGCLKSEVVRDCVVGRHWLRLWPAAMMLIQQSRGFDVVVWPSKISVFLLSRVICESYSLILSEISLIITFPNRTAVGKTSSNPLPVTNIFDRRN